MFNNKVYHKIDALSGSVATLRAEGVRYNEIAEIESRAGTSLAQVIKLDGPNAKSLEATPDQVKVLIEQAKDLDPGRVFRVCDQLA